MNMQNKTRKKKVFRKFVLLTLCALLLGLVAIGTFSVFADSHKVQAFASNRINSNTYVINEASNLLALAENVNNGLRDGYYGIEILLTKDIDIQSLCGDLDSDNGWIPIGTALYPFKGTFNGNGYSILGLTINREDTEYVGLFGFADINSTVKNLTVSGSVKGNSYTGGIIGYNQGLVSHCKGNVSVTAKDKSVHIGGIAGYNYSTGSIISCESVAGVSAGFAAFIGGIAGSNLGAVEKCYNTSAVKSIDSVVGGIVGNNTATGNISVCFNSGRITGKSTIGGIVGNNQGTAKNIFHRGLIDSTNGSAGGIAGSNESSGIISYSFSASSVTGHEDIAAICGYNQGLVIRSFYDSSVFDGKIINGISAEESHGFSTRVLSHSDVLTSTQKMAALLNDNANMWAKSNSMDSASYPMLKYFAEDFSLISKEVGKITITHLTESDISLGSSEFVYNGESRFVSIYYGSILLEQNQDYAANYSNNLNAGTAILTITFLNSFSGSAIKPFTIKKSALVVNWNTLEFTYNGMVHFPTVAIIEGLIGTENVTFNYINVHALNAGVYDIAAVLEDTSINANYSLPLTESQYKILKAAITVTWTHENFVYNGNVQLPIASVAMGQVGVEAITFSYEYASNINAGFQKISAYLAFTDINDNYDFLGDTYVYTIAKKPIIVAWDQTVLHYNGMVQYPTSTVASGKVSDEDITFVYSGYLNNVNANETSEYSVSLALADTSTNSNYDFTPETYYYMIYKALLTLGWWDMPLVYTGESQYPGFYIANGRIGEEEIQFSILGYLQNINASAGNAYEIEVVLLDSKINGNYAILKTVKNYDIKKADFMPNKFVQFPSQTFGYDGLDKSIYIQGALPLGITVSYENNSHNMVGEYVVIAKFAFAAQNFNPPTIDTLSAKLCIARMIFDDSENGITIANKGDASYDYLPSVEQISKCDITEKGKKSLLAYRVSSGNSILEISILLKDEYLKNNGLKLLYKNSDGEIIMADYTIVDRLIIFSMNDAVEFVLLSDNNLLWLWLSLGGVGAFLLAGIAFAFVKKKRRLFVVEQTAYIETSVDGQSALIDFEVTQADNCNDNYFEQSATVQNNLPFKFGGVECLSYEWFIKSLSFKTADKQKRVCSGDSYALSLVEAMPKNAVYWLGKRYQIDSKEYKKLLNKAKEAAYEKA